MPLKQMTSLSNDFIKFCAYIYKAIMEFEAEEGRCHAPLHLNCLSHFRSDDCINVGATLIVEVCRQISALQVSSIYEHKHHAQAGQQYT